jgi:spore coat protein U-like protein
MKRILLITGLLAVSLVFTGVAAAATATGYLQVTATVGSVCNVSTTAVNFGSVTGAATADGDVTVNCPPDTPYNIALDAGQNFDGQIARHVAYPDQQQQGMIVGPAYYLYKDSVANGTPWGDSDFDNTYPSGSSLSDTGSGNPQAHPVYGSLDNFSGIPAFTVMSDTVVVTVHY